MQTAKSKVNVWLAYLDIDECAIGTHSCSADAECNISRDRTTVNVNLDILGTDAPVQVIQWNIAC